MKAHIVSLSFTIFIAISLVSRASADWSLGSNFGYRSAHPEALNNTSNSDDLQIKSVSTFGIDFLWKSQFPVGLKYDSDSVDRTGVVAGASAQRKITSSWLSLLGGYTFFGEDLSADGVQASVLAEYGLWQSSRLTLTDGVNHFSDVSGRRASSVGAYLEVLKAWDHLVLGIQLGFLQRKIRDFEVSSNSFIGDSSGSPMEVDLSGPITNLILGWRF